MTLSISVIVPAYNAAKILPFCLRALRQQTHAADEIIVVDDGSTDETAQIAQSFGATCFTQTHHGPAAARNLGVEHAHSDLILFTDADCEPLPDWIEKMIAPLADKTISGTKGTYRTLQQNIIARFVQAEYEDKYDLMGNHETIDFVDTYAAAYRRSVYNENGGMDPSFPRASGEDIDLSYRLAQRGHRLILVRAASVYHRHPDSLGKYLRRKFHVGYWRVRMYQKTPSKMIADSHTPQSLKLQMGLIWAIGLAWGASLIWTSGWIVLLVFAILFWISVLPFVAKTWARDKTIAILAPMFMVLRAMALDAGFLIGLVGHLWQRTRK